MHIPRFVIILFVVVLLGLISTVFRTNKAAEQAHLIYFTFRVVDADSHAPLPRYDFKFPENESSGTPQEGTLLRGQDFSFFATISSKPVTIRISNEGYQETSFEISSKGNVVTAGSLPEEVRTIALTKEH